MALGTRYPPHMFFAFAIAAFIFVSFLLYNSVDSSDRRRIASYNHLDAPDVARLKEKLGDLEKEVQLNDKYVNDLDEKLNRLANDQSERLQKVDPGAPQGQGGVLAPPPASPAAPPQNVHLKEEELAGGGNKVQVVHQVLKAKSTPPTSAATRNFVAQVAPVSGSLVCPAASIPHEAEGDVQMLNAYEAIPFDNPDGGVWKQGWELTYDKEKIKQEKKLEVVVIPHSHCDPGWLQTFESYYEAQTKQILDGMVKHLPEKAGMKFIYAEMSFFELWWSTQTEETRNKVKELLKTGQFEIVTGGWVMTDEANAHLYSIVMETFEGHEFLKNQIGYHPKNHWSIDPFGISPTIAQVMKASNLSHMVIQRVHYSVKKYLAKNRQLEFRWRQLFAGKSAKTDIVTHMFPFYSYDVPHTCGPDPKTCCQFDFRRMTGIGCPWGKQPVRINSKNVAARAELLADQYRKKAQLYSKNVLLIPLGDDFRYDTNAEWDDQYDNYRQLFEYMNKQAEWNINARFGTLEDYFKLLEGRLSEETDPKEKITFWLNENGHRVLIAAGDTFRAGAVEQLRTHTRHLNALHPQGVQLYEQGYDKNPAELAKAAVKIAMDRQIDVVLVDTAGRMQDNEPLMRALSTLIQASKPDLVLFVGEALVGNEAVDQLVKFNQALANHSATNDKQPRLIDGIVLTKFDTIDDKVGAAVSMTYITGQPIVFVGTGQTYKDLKNLNANAVVNSLLK